MGCVIINVKLTEQFYKNTHEERCEMTIYLWILSGLVLLIFLVWFFFGRTDLARTANLLVDLVIIVTVCAVFGVVSYFQFQNKDTEEITAVESSITETTATEPAEQETAVADTPKPVKDIEDITVSGNAAQLVTPTSEATAAQ